MIPSSLSEKSKEDWRSTEEFAGGRGGRRDCGMERVAAVSGRADGVEQCP